MGCGFSMDASEDAIRRRQEKDEKENKELCKILFLGAGESGKSTVLKQMTYLYAPHDIPKGTYLNYLAHQVSFMLLETIQVLIQQTEIWDQKAQEDGNESKIQYKISDDEDVQEAKLHIEGSLKLNVARCERISEETAGHIKTLWSDEGIQNTFKKRRYFQCPDSAEYFMTRLDEVWRDDYQISEQDYIQVRVRSTGVTKRDFVLDGQKYRLVDVGGQRNERKKWIHVFSDVTAVVFVVGTSGYCHKCFEDDSTNRLKESLDLFEQILEMTWFATTPMILLLNKADIFRERLKETPFTVCFEDYSEDPHDYDKAMEYIKSTFLKKNLIKDRDIYTHVTIATDRSNVEEFFGKAVDNINIDNLRDGGLE